MTTNSLPAVALVSFRGHPNRRKLEKIASI